MIISNEKLSATMVTKNAEGAFTREQLLKWFRRNNILDENGMPTEIGMKFGVSLAEKETGKYPVYDTRMQMIIERYIPSISAIQTQENNANSNIAKNIEREAKGYEDKKEVPENTISLSFLNSVPFEGFHFLSEIMTDFVILDTETTGFTKSDEVVEIGITDCNGNEIYHSLFRNTKPMNPDAAKVNNINPEELKKAPCIADEYEKIVSILDGKTVLGHNISFDNRLLKQSFARYGKTYSGFANMIDSQKIAKRYLKAEKFSLDHLAKLLGIAEDEKHRAVDDCIMTIQMLRNLEKLLAIRERAGSLLNNV